MQLIDELQHANDITLASKDWRAEHSLRSVPTLLVVFLVKALIQVGVLDVNEVPLSNDRPGKANIIGDSDLDGAVHGGQLLTRRVVEVHSTPVGVD